MHSILRGSGKFSRALFVSSGRVRICPGTSGICAYIPDAAGFGLDFPDAIPYNILRIRCELAMPGMYLPGAGRMERGVIELKRDGSDGTRDGRDSELSELRALVGRDALTGLYNKYGFEREVKTCLRSSGSGTMFVMDMDFFKQVNDQYGHLAGDNLLKETAGALEGLLPGCLVARVGGDEFAAFLPEELDDEGAVSACRRVESWFGENTLLGRMAVSVGMTVDWAHSDRGSFQGLFDVADQKMMERKRARNRAMAAGAVPCASGEGEGTGMLRDLDLLLREMNEGNSFDGAYLEDYPTFRRMYQLEVRRQKRLDNSVYLMLLTLTDRSGEFLQLDTRLSEMQVLGSVIRNNLRVGDVYCQYSASQYLILAMDTDESEAELILDRVKRVYDEEKACPDSELALRKCCPLTGSDGDCVEC